MEPQKWEIRKNGHAYCGGATMETMTYSDATLRSMAKAGYVLYINGKAQKPPTAKKKTKGDDEDGGAGHTKEKVRAGKSRK